MISVILPTHNRATLVTLAVESVLNQTFQDIELIVVDDGSTDNTEETLRPYLSRIHYIHQSQGGPGKARNRGIQEARGEYIAFIDDDDIWLPFKLELQIGLLLKHPELALVCTNFKVFDSKGECDSFIEQYFGLFKRTGMKFDNIFQNKELISSRMPNESVPHSRYFYWGQVFPTVFQGSLIFQSSILARKKIFQEMGGYDEALSDNEDYKICLKICQKYSIGYVDIDTLRVKLAENTRSNDSSKRTKFWENNLSIVESALNQPENLPRLTKEIIRTRLSLMYHKIGLYALGDGDNRKARRYLNKLILISPLEIKAYILWAMTFLPASFIEGVRKIRRNIRNPHILKS
ncbi:MAG: glycosyltransferase family 2 protein [Leptospirales bacterium]